MKSSRGVTLIDTIVGIALMIIVFVGIAGVFELSVDVVTNNKARSGAIALADQRMEYIRSLAYASVGTIGGVPSGTIPQSETVSLNGVSYTRRTVIEYVDDPKDGSGSSDTNGITEDYKAVKVDLAWTSRTGTRHVTLVTRVTPAAGLEANPCSSACGTLFISAVNSQSAVLSGASVSIVDASVTPAVNINTFTNASGTVTIIGAPAGSGYQITVSNTGYSTAQTYSTTAQNTNPNPGNLTVSNNHTTSGTFAIDLLGSQTINTLTAVTSGSWSDPLTNTSKLASSTNITISGGNAQLSGSSGSYPSWGEFQSIGISPTGLVTWQSFSTSTTTPSGTAIKFHFFDGSGNLIPDSVLAGNAAGFATSSVNLSGVSTTTYPIIAIDAVLTTNTSAQTPVVHPYSVQYTYGGLPLPNIAFTLQGAKTIGSGPSGVLYKYSQLLNSGASASLTVLNLEWDTYTMSVAGSSGYDIASSCPNPQPETLPAGGSITTSLYLAAHTTNSLLVSAHSAATGALITNASVHLSRTGYSSTISTDSCGQAFFSGLTAASNYSISVSATGYTTYNASSINISGTSGLSIGL